MMAMKYAAFLMLHHVHFMLRLDFAQDKYKMDPSWIKEGAVVINVALDLALLLKTSLYGSFCCGICENHSEENLTTPETTSNPPKDSTTKKTRVDQMITTQATSKNIDEKELLSTRPGVRHKLWDTCFHRPTYVAYRCLQHQLLYLEFICFKKSS